MQNANQSDFNHINAPCANPVFFRTYSRLKDTKRESWGEVSTRCLQGIAKLGNLTQDEASIIADMLAQQKCLPSGRWLWVGGTAWLDKPGNTPGAYNCTSTNVIDWRSFGLMMDLAMMGCGTGAVLEYKYIKQLPVIRNELIVTVKKSKTAKKREETEIVVDGNQVEIRVGDSRQGWVRSYQTILELSSDARFTDSIQVTVDISHIRAAGEVLKGFGGTANPVKLPELYTRCASVLNKAIGRQLNSVECCLLIDEAAACVVAGNIRRCLPEDALVHTSKGLVAIKDVQVGDLVQTPLGFRKVLDKFDQGYQDVYEIETNATLPRATLNHRQAVLADAQGNVKWKSLANLVPGDRLLHNTQILPGTVTSLPIGFAESRPVQNSTAKPIFTPQLTPEIAWLVGFTHGNGEVAFGRNTHDKGHVEWSMNSLDSELTLRIQEKLDIALAAFNLKATHGVVKGKNTAKSVCSSIRFAEDCYHYIKQPNISLQIPDFILQGSVDIRAAYLAGLMDSDGAVNNQPPQRVTTVYRSFIRQVASVLSSLGIAGRISIAHNYHTKYQKWQAKYNLTIPALKDAYNALIAPHSLKGKLKQGLKMDGFTVPGTVMHEVYTYGEMQDMSMNDSFSVDENYEHYIAESDISLDIPVTVKALGSVDYVQTYDIEVDEAHCFYCDGYLTHNSAGMRQASNDDKLFANAKANLWQQAEDGNWRIDPERDALRMANHTRVFHKKPTLEDCKTSVATQYYSGEGAIQWVGEALVRANADLLKTIELKKAFLHAYENDKAALWLRNNFPKIGAQEIEHRLARYGLNPCITADSWIHTEQGARQVKDLIGKQTSVYVNGELFSTTTDGFWLTGVKPIFKVVTQEGYELRLTENHQLLKVTAQTQKKQYTQWVQAQDLKPGDYILVHNHRGVQPWDSFGTFDEGWLLGSLIGDGSIASTQWGKTAYLRYWQDNQEEMAGYAVALLKNAVNFSSDKPNGCYNKQSNHREINSSGLARLAADYDVTLQHKMPTDKIEQASYEFYCGFLRGFFDADGSVQGNHQKGISIRLAQSNLESLKIVQRMLARLGIISTIYQERRPEGYHQLPDSNRELAPYFCKTQHELVISNDNLYSFQEIVGFQEPQKATRLQELLCGYKRNLNRERFAVKIKQIIPDGLEAVYDCTVPGASQFDANGIVAHNCGEIVGSDYFCNLSEIHLNQIDPNNSIEQVQAFTAGALSVAALLNHEFTEPRYQYSRELDPIVGVSFTGLFDFFVKAFGLDWLNWWVEGRPDTTQGLYFKNLERNYLSRWKSIVHKTVWDYCDRHGIKRPNRCTTVQPSGTKSLLTGASPGWHPPKAQRFIRRITFRRDDPVALACLDFGYTIIPSQADKDEKGNLLNDPFDSRCTEWLVEIPVAVPWADVPGADQIAIDKFSALAQMDFYMQVQKFYVTHNTSATIEVRQDEIDGLATRIHQAIQNDEGYISVALLARFDDLQTFPRLPFEPIDKEKYDELADQVKRRRISDDFGASLSKYSKTEWAESSPAGCDSDKCLLPETKTH